MCLFFSWCCYVFGLLDIYISLFNIIQPSSVRFYNCVFRNHLHISKSSSAVNIVRFEVILSSPPFAGRNPMFPPCMFKNDTCIIILIYFLKESYILAIFVLPCGDTNFDTRDSFYFLNELCNYRIFNNAHYRPRVLNVCRKYINFNLIQNFRWIR